MSLEFTVLGSGSASASNGKAVRSPSGYAARAGETLLTHLNDESAASARRLIKGDPRVSLARDLMRRRI